MSHASRARAAVRKQKGTLELTNEQIRQASAGVVLLLKERLPREIGWALQTRNQALKFALAPVDAEHDRLVQQYARRDRKKRVISGDIPGSVQIAPGKEDAFKEATDGLWATTQRVAIEPIKRADIPERVEGRPLVVPGIVWDFLDSILTD